MMLALGFGIGAYVLCAAATRTISGIITSAILGVIIGFIVYIGMPILSYGFFGWPFLITLLGVGVMGLSRWSNYTHRKIDPIGYIVGAVVVSIGLLFLIIIPALSTPAWIWNNSKDYFGILSNGSVIGDNRIDKDAPELIFDAEVSYIDERQVRLVDGPLAMKIAEVELNKDPGLGSRTQIGQMSIQSVGGKLYWVGPLEWSGFWKWANAPENGTPGYMVVSVTNQQDYRLIQTDAGSPIQLRYGRGAFFGDNLKRFIYSKYAMKPFTDITFEVDDNWKPHYVITMYENTVHYGGAKATGVAILDPQTGEIIEYGIDDSPEWVDRIQPEWMVAEQVDSWGEFVHGWWSNLEGLDVLTHTTSANQGDSGLSLVYDSNGRSMWYTGIQSSGVDEGTTGFALVDSRTGATRYYRQSGITESACQKNIYALVAEKDGWSVSNCILYNVSGRPTYIAVVKDAEGNPKGVGVASVEYRDVVVHHATISGALRTYRTKLNSTAHVGATDNDTVVVTVAGIVYRVGRENLDGNTVFYIMIQEQPGMMFQAIAGNNPEIALTLPGDFVSFEYFGSHSTVSDISSFLNETLHIRESETEQVIERDAKAVRESNGHVSD